MKNYNWKNVLDMEGQVDPATIEKAKKAVDLEEKIEWWLDQLNWIPKKTGTHDRTQDVIKMYAKQYKELTGEWYRRDWN